MKTNSILRSLLVLSFLAVMSLTAYSQSIYNADIRETVELWEEFNDGISLGNGSSPWGQIELPTGFNFRYGSSNMLVTDVYAYGNGYLSFNVFRQPSDFFIPYLAEYPNMVSWYGINLFTSGKLSYKLTGEAPFRVLTIQQTGARHFLDFSGREMDVQIKLYETINEIKIIYGKVTAFGGANINGYLYFTDNNAIGGSTPRRYQYLNIKPNVFGSPATIYQGNIDPNTDPHLTRNLRQFFPEGRAFTYSQQPSLAGISPLNHLFALGDIIGDVNDEDGRPYIVINRATGQSEIEYKYRITGPIGDPASSVIYEAYLNSSDWIDPNPQPLGSDFKIVVRDARGIAAGENGALDLTNPLVLGGRYRVDVDLRQKNSGVVLSNSTFITIAEQRDLAIVGLEQPISINQTTYPEGANIPVTFIVQNQGVDPIDEYQIKYTVVGINNGVTESLTQTVELDDPLEFRDQRVTSMPAFANAPIGEYRFSVEANLISTLGDDIPENNKYPMDNSPNYLFKVAKEFDGTIAEIINPPSLMSAKEPTVPLVRLRNEGISPITNASMTMVITDPDGNEVYNQTVLVEEIPAGLVNTVEIDFPKTFVPNNEGSYTVQVDVAQTGDDASASKSISVTQGLAGLYYITAGSTGDRYFNTISEAVQVMYDKGVSDDVTFLLQDAMYVEGNLALMDPALDLSSKILGLGDEGATVKFMPDEATLLGNHVNIYLLSGSGIGVKMGNSSSHPYSGAPVNNVHISDKNDYSISNGYIIFDGGSRKALNFSVVSNSPSRAVFYLVEGAKNNQILNSNIRGEVEYQNLIYPASYACNLPRTRYNASTQLFEFQQLSNSIGDLSTGILLKGDEHKFATTNVNYFNVPNENINNNKISGNEISDFGYGIVSLGIGSLFDEETNDFVRYFNHNNEFSNNSIYDVSKAGIFAGFEENSSISHNNIYNVNGTCSGDAAGIMLGSNDIVDGLSDIKWLGYGVNNMSVNGNEISFIRASENLYGIKLEQRVVNLEDRDQTITYPSDGAIEIKSNIIRDLRPLSANTNIFAVSAKPALTIGQTIDWSDLSNIPLHNPDTFVDNVWFVNNTIWMNNDDFENLGAYSAFALLNVHDSYFFNNAIAMVDNNISPNAPEASALIFRGQHPNRNGLWSDRNVYWISNKDLVSNFRFVEIDDENRLLELGFKDEFRDLDQWQYWTDQDKHSVFGNFTNDLEYTDVNPFKLRVKTDPLPKASLLNNRGLNEDILRENPDYSTYDIDGVERGRAGERYDVGAQEFNGRMSGRDLEILRIVEPGVYKATSPREFSDAEYVMIDENIGAEITTLIRNNSNIIVSGATITATVYREDPLSGIPNIEVASFEGQINDLFQAESKMIQFTESFMPSPYSDFAENLYSIPNKFKFLTTNVTPLYKFVFHLEDDEYVSNNRIEKNVRFFIKRSRLGIVVSSEFTSFNDETNLDAIPLYYAASNMNLDSLISGFAGLSWFHLPSTEGDVDYDIFDRSSWEPRSVDYTLYRFLIWSDGHDILPNGDDYVIGRYSRDHIAEFLASGTPSTKKHFVAGSQDMVRNNFNNGIEDFNSTVLRTQYLAPGNPQDVNGDYSDLIVTGVNVARDIEFTIDSTRYENDDHPKAGLVQPVSNPDEVGQTKVAMRYNSHFNDNPPTLVAEDQRTMGVVTQAITENVIYFGLDWRHWTNIEETIRALFDYLLANDAVPVELAGFEAEQAGSRVDISWRTASEHNSSHFDVEKAIVNNGSEGLFTTIDEVEAAGNSMTFKHYNASDLNVNFGDTYAYRLKAVDNDGTFEYSEVKYVTVTGALGDFRVEDPTPNPATYDATIEFTLSTPMNVNIELYNAQGAKVANVFNGIKESGVHNQDIDLNRLSSGSYTMIIKIGADVMTKHINVVR